MIRSWKGRLSRLHTNCNMDVHKPRWKGAGEKTPSYRFYDIEKINGYAESKIEAVKDREAK